MNQTSKQKIFCYVDESGQDARSKVFVVVALVTDEDITKIRQTVEKVELTSGAGFRKWHKLTTIRKRKFIRLVLEQEVAKGDIFYGMYEKPIPYFLPMLNVLEKAIKLRAPKNYQANVYVDGIDKKKARELTNALRVEGVSLSHVRNKQDESESLIRLVDRWAGCIRSSLENKNEETAFVKKAQKQGYLTNVNN